MKQTIASILATPFIIIGLVILAFADGGPKQVVKELKEFFKHVVKGEPWN